MNLSNCKTIEEYREAAHYWQKKWEDTYKELKEYKQAIEFAANKLNVEPCRLFRQ